MMSEAYLKPGVNIRPVLDLKICENLVKKLYGLECLEIKELNGYDDKNYKIKVRQEEDTFVLKVLNNLDSKKLGFIEGQNEMLLFLGQNDFRCPKPIKNLLGKYYSLEKLESGEHVVRLMVFIPGSILFEIPLSPKLFYKVGNYVATLDNKLETFNHKAYDTHITTWMLDSVPLLRNFLFVITNIERRQMIEKIIDEFEEKVLKNKHLLPVGIIHGDFNEQNVIVEQNEHGEWDVAGVIDFGDSNKSTYIYELAISATYMMIVGKDLDVGGYVLAGYTDVRKISEFEYSLFKICIMARLTQSLVLGAYSSLQDPDNSYILTTAAPGWELLTKLQSEPEHILLQHWKTISENYKRPNIE